MILKTKASRHQGIKASSGRSRLSTLSHGSKPRAFTLIELIVVIAIIAMLVGLTLGVLVIVSRKSEIRETENILRLLDGALQDWENSSERQLSWGTNPAPPAQVFDLSANLNGEDQMNELLTRFTKTPSTAQGLAQINQDYFISQQLPGNITRLSIKDAWGNKIVVVHPGRVPNALVFSGDGDTVPPAGSPFADPDGTIRTSDSHMQTPSVDVNEIKFGVCANRRLCFVSAGPDNRFGNMHMNTNQSTLTATQLKDIAEAADNLYSYPILKERAP